MILKARNPLMMFQLLKKVKVRWIVMLMGHLAYFCSVVIASALTIGIIAMTDEGENSNNSTQSNSTFSNSQSWRVDWDEIHKDRMLQAFFWGSMATSLPGGRLGELFGPRRTIGLALFSAGFSFLFYPIVALQSFWAAYAIRVAQGLSYGLVVPTMGCVIARWSPQNEITLANMVSASGIFSANAIVHPMAGLLAGGDFLGGWPSIFYVFGSLTLLTTIPWYFLVYDDPKGHPRISREELEEIMRTRSLKNGVSKKLPWLKMLTSLPVFGYVIMMANHSWLLSLVSSQISCYYDQILNMSFEMNGLMTALPWVLSLITGILSSALADCIRRTNRISLTTLRKGFTISALGCAGIGMCLITFVGLNQAAVVALITLATGISALTSAGSTSNHLDIGPTFAGTLAGLGITGGSLGALAMNEAVTQIVGNEPTQEKWYLFFYLTGAVNLIGALLFCIFGLAQVQKWDPSWQPEVPVEKRSDENQNYDFSREP